MALDTRNKRASAFGWGLACCLVLPNPDGTIDAADRQQVALCYAGIAADDVLVVAARRLAVTRASRTRTATPASEN